ncbi:hypothetical protein E2562_038384 [Oryza meyeriana var. granulata]|uniref:Uncharacterized protein n=1 Tax=Oryza meyeriana var. granulata TaxID=110450 RepID=A0A6G1CZF7_9ORYZ|nr:hypothetical protein E2562_038384 [Oryza meyeriana var. granulata]
MAATSAAFARQGEELVGSGLLAAFGKALGDDRVHVKCQRDGQRRRCDGRQQLRQLGTGPVQRAKVVPDWVLADWLEVLHPLRW